MPARGSKNPLLDASSLHSRIMESSSDFQNLQSDVTKNLIAFTRTATQISAEDLGFHRSLDPTIAASLDAQNARLLSLAGRLLSGATTDSEAVGSTLSLQDAEDLRNAEGSWRSVVDVVDSLLEKADTSLDEYTGVVKRLSPALEQVGSLSNPLYVRMIADIGAGDTEEEAGRSGSCVQDTKPDEAADPVRACTSQQ